MALSRAIIAKLRPYLEGDGPNEDGEWGMHCPKHNDGRRSASVNIETGLWYCQACQVGGPVKEILEELTGEISYDFSEGTAAPKSDKPKPVITDAQVRGWHAALLGEKGAMHELMQRRGLHQQTIKDHLIGWDTSQGVYTIPIYDREGNIVNVRFYQMDAPADRRKIWSVEGLGTPTLYPIAQAVNKAIVLCEGEWDALVLIQNGIPAITRTGSAKTWKSAWSALFTGKKVFLCHDMDTTGQEANDKIASALRKYAAEVRIVHLPYEVTEKHGKDVSDFFLDGNTSKEFKALVRQAKVLSSAATTETDEARPELVGVSVLDSFDARNAGRPMTMQVTITGKKSPGYVLPERVDFTCGLDNGSKCENCIMKVVHNGHASLEIPPHDPILLAMMGSTDQQLQELLRQHMGIVKCPKFETTRIVERTVEEVFARPSIELRDTGKSADFTHRRIVVVGRHDLEPNTTVDMTGTIRPSPKTQNNEFQVWSSVTPVNTLDSFSVTPNTIAEMSVFKCKGDPLKALRIIADDLSSHVTRIYQRPEMHMLMDLVFHSAIGFYLGGTYSKGWLDVMIVGDTRTGKSEAAGRLVDWYDLGEIISCETATFAGIMGGLDRIDDQKWTIKWGAVPINDRRLVVLDEASGLEPSHFAQMSAIRSSGVAELNKIRTERAPARTRLLWLANPRNSTLAEFAYGALAIQPLVGNAEDVARFDGAMAVESGAVSSAAINTAIRDLSEPLHSRTAYQTLLRWAWTRRPEDVIITEQAEAKIYEAAVDMGDRYVESPPLVQAANVRFKIARWAIAVAARTFSTDETCQAIVVEPRHVTAAVRFLDQIYGMTAFGYAALSRARRSEIERATVTLDDSLEWILNKPGLVRFLRDNQSFKRNDMMDGMNLSAENMQAILHELISRSIVRRDGGLYRPEPGIIRALRDIDIDTMEDNT